MTGESWLGKDLTTNTFQIGQILGWHDLLFIILQTTPVFVLLSGFVIKQHTAFGNKMIINSLFLASFSSSRQSSFSSYWVWSIFSSPQSSSSSEQCGLCYYKRDPFPLIHPGLHPTPILWDTRDYHLSHHYHHYHHNHHHYHHHHYHRNHNNWQIDHHRSLPGIL